MSMLVQYNHPTNKRARLACNIHKKKKGQKRKKVREILATHEKKKSDTLTFMLNFLFLIGVFAVLAYFR